MLLLSFIAAVSFASLLLCLCSGLDGRRALADDIVDVDNLKVPHLCNAESVGDHTFAILSCAPTHKVLHRDLEILAERLNLLPADLLLLLKDRLWLGGPSPFLDRLLLVVLDFRKAVLDVLDRFVDPCSTVKQMSVMQLILETRASTHRKAS